MKAIILISSIFYFLGLLIGNMFHIAKESTPPIETIIVNKIKTIQPEKVFHFGEEKKEKPATTTTTTTTKDSKTTPAENDNSTTDKEVVSESK